jgi:hypothetical protein
MHLWMYEQCGVVQKYILDMHYIGQSSRDYE